jgi:glutamyl/glutaminyl-tRNA synthetase
MTGSAAGRSTKSALLEDLDWAIRGCDLLPSTGRQLQLARLLGRASPPLFVHHPLICKPGGVKLSKATETLGSESCGDREFHPAQFSVRLPI